MMKRRMLPAFWLTMSMVLSAQVQPPATVHIYREKLSVGLAAHPTVSCDAFPVARMQNGRVYTMKASAGRHVFSTTGNPTGITVDVESGKEYFVRIDFPPNAIYGGSASPVLVAPEEGRMEIVKLRALDGRFIEAATCGKP